MHKRVDEIKRTLNLLEALNAGKEVHNVLGLRFDLRQLKVCLMGFNSYHLYCRTFGYNRPCILQLYLGEHKCLL